MPLETLATIDATVTSTDPPNTIDAQVLDSPEVAAYPRTIAATLSRLFINSFDGVTSCHGYRLLIDGEDVTPFVVGAIQEEKDGYTGEIRVSFALRGERFALWNTLLTSTLLPEVRLEVEHGQSPADMVADPPVYLRIVGAQQRPDDGNRVVVDIECRDEFTARLKGTTLCFSVEPLADVSVGWIISQALLGAGMTSEIPDGRIFPGRISEEGTPTRQRLAELAETEGWHFRAPDRVVRVGTMKPRPANQAPDYVLTPERWNLNGGAPDAGSPQDVPFRYVVKGERSVKADDQAGGVEVIREVLIVRGIFAPEQAVGKQQGGVDNPDLIPNSTGPSPIATDKEISKMVINRTLVNGKPTIEEVIEYAWTWTPRAIVNLQPSGNKHYFIPGVWVDGDGNGRTTEYQRYREERRTVTGWKYAPDGSVRSKVSTVYGYLTRDQPVHPPNNPDQINVFGWAYGDGRSYAEEIATPNHRLEQITWGYSYRPDGKLRSETATRWRYYLRSARSDGAVGSDPPVLLNHDGRGQVAGIATWTKTNDSVTRYVLTSTGQRTSQIYTENGYRVIPRQNGNHVIDGVETDFSVVLYGLISSKIERTTYKRVTRNQTEVTPWKPGELPKTDTVLAPMPVSPGIPSRSTTTRIQPLYRTEEDPAILAAYGPRAKVIQSDFADSADVLQRLLEAARRRDLAIEMAVTRRLSPVEPGDTVDIWDPDGGMKAPRRGLCVNRRRSLSPRGFAEELTLEVERDPL